MEDKKAYEAFRVQQFAHPALQHVQAAAAAPPRDGGTPSTQQAAVADPLNVNLTPDHERVVLHFDVDAMYAQVEECRNPSLRGQPLAVTQKYLVVTCNYPARAAGVTKLMGIKDARKICPKLILVPGEDLTPYRAASRDIRAVLSRWGPTEKLGLDESWVDITQEVNRRLHSAHAASNIISAAWCGHLVSSGLQLTAHSRHRPMDLRVVPQHGEQGQLERHQGQVKQQQQEQQQEHGRDELKEQADGSQPEAVLTLRLAASDAASVTVTAAAAEPTSTQVPPAAGHQHHPAWLAECELRLKLGACVAAEMRAAVKQETGLRCSAGIACSKLLSKLVSGLHKPDDQTTILPTQAQDFVGPLPVRALPGVGYKAEGLLKLWGVSTAADARHISKQQLIQGLGEKHGLGLFHACRGVDPSLVVASGPPKSITVEDSFKACSSWTGVSTVLQVLVPDLIDRLQEDAQEFPQLHRTPTTLTVKWRKTGTGWARTSASAAWPPAARLPAPQQLSVQQQQLLQLHQQQPQQLVPVQGAADAIAAVTAAATSLLKQHLPATGWGLTLLNIGATGFKARPGVGAAGGIHQFLVPKSTATPAAVSPPAAAAAAAGTAGGSSPAAAASAAAAAGHDLLQQAKAATESRRDYDKMMVPRSSNLGVLQQPSSATGADRQQQQQEGSRVPLPQAASPQILSKRQERRLWELAMMQQQAQLPNQCQPVEHNSVEHSVWQHHLMPAAAPQPSQQQQESLDQTSGHIKPSHQPGPTQHEWAPLPQDSDPCNHSTAMRSATAPATLQVAAEGSAGLCSAAALHSPAATEHPLAKRHCTETRTSSSLADTAAVDEMAAPADDFDADGGGGGGGGGGVCSADLGTSCCYTTNLHSVEGWGLVACEVLEDFEEEAGSEGVTLGSE